MKNLFYGLLLMGVTAFSQKEVTLSPFSKITSFDQIDVVLIKTNGTPKVVLNGDESENVEIIQKGYELKIRMPLLKLLKGDNVSATVFYNNEINQFEANEGSRIASNDYFNGAYLRFIAKEGAEIKLKIETGKINVKVASGATVSLSGAAKIQEVVTNTGGKYDGRQLTTNQTVISSNSGGDACVNTTESLEAKIFAGGVISVYGDPKKISQKITGGGRIEQLK